MRRGRDPYDPAGASAFDARQARGSRRYQVERAKYLAANPYCAGCAAEGRTALARELDHKIPVRGDPMRFWDKGNWQGLCSPCHNEKTLGEIEADRDEWAQEFDRRIADAL